MKIEKVMTPNAKSVEPLDTVANAARKIRDLNIGALPVTENQQLVGIITDRDITVRAVAEGRSTDSTPVREVMSSGIVYAFNDQEVEEVAALMEANQVRRVPVVDREKRLVGIVSLGDLALEPNGEDLGGHALKEISRPAR
jgi:CBS domain-containing protein